MDSRGSRSDASFVTVRTSCPMVDDSKAEGNNNNNNNNAQNQYQSQNRITESSLKEKEK